MSDYIYYNNLNDTELLDLVEEHYYSIGATGAQAMETLLSDISEGFWERHGVPEKRIHSIAVMFTKSLNERNAWSAMAGVVTDTDRKRKQGVSRLGSLIRAKKR
jgi:hypothetical protein